MRQRIDRAFFEYRADRLAIAVGRQAVSYGNGLVFSPPDLSNPFSPTETDRDCKAGDDLALVQWLFEDGSDLQLLGVDIVDFSGPDVSGVWWRCAGSSPHSRTHGRGARR